MNGINNDRGIKQGKLEHIFIGTVKSNGEVSGYHCDKKYGDEKVYAEVVGQSYGQTKLKGLLQFLLNKGILVKEERGKYRLNRDNQP